MGDRLDKEHPEPVQVEDLLGHDETTHEERKLERHHRKHRQHGVLQRVA